MKKFNKYIAYLLLLGSLIISGCSSQKRVHPHYKRYHQHKKVYTQKAVPAAYSFPQRGINYQTDRKMIITPNPYSNSNRPKVSRSMQELDRDSANVQPTLVYNYPLRNKSLNAEFVDLSYLKYKMLNYINAIRARGNSCGSSASRLNWSNKLENAAIAHASDMATNNFLSHLGSGRVTDIARKANGAGSNFYERIIHFGYPVQSGELAGEILTYTKYNIVGNKDPFTHFIHAIENFQRSPKHCSILMNPRFKDIAIAAYKNNQKIYWVIEYGEKSR